MVKRNLDGWKKQPEDTRDYKFSFIETAPLPPKADLRKTGFLPVIKNQGNIGSCVSFACTAAMQYLENRDKEKVPGFSELFVYWNGRELEGTTGSDNGLYIRDAIKVIKRSGCCLEATWPYRKILLFKKPLDPCYKEGKKHCNITYMAPSSLKAIKTAISGGLPVIGGVEVYDSFMSDDATETGIIPMPGKDEQLLGGHAILFVGYDDAKKLFIFRNSWGKSWGSQGYGFIPYDYLMTYGSDFWVLTSETCTK